MSSRSAPRGSDRDRRTGESRRCAVAVRSTQRTTTLPLDYTAALSSRGGLMPMMSRRCAIGFAGPLLAVAIVSVRVWAGQSVVPSGLFSYDQLPVRASGSTEIRQMLTGATHSGYRIDLHATDLAAGQMPHAAHHHVHEEL